MKSKKIKDERVIQLNNKIQSEAYIIVIFIALISMFIKASVLDLPFLHYAVELGIASVSIAYVVIRSMLIGHPIMEPSKSKKSLFVFSVLLPSFIITFINAVRNYSLYENKYTGISDVHFIAVIAVTFISSLLFISILCLFLYWADIQSQKEIEKKLNEDQD